MGWRSWNAFGDFVNQTLMTSVVDGLTMRVNPLPNGTLASLADLGYSRVGLDDGWQACGAGVNGSFHNAAGHAIIDTGAFPDLGGWVKYATSLGLKADWYKNNDGCCEDGKVGPYYQNDANDLAALGFQGVKFDNCGPGRNLTLWATALNDTGVEVLIENCNDEFPFRPTVNPDGSLDCPYHMYRTGSDNSPTWLTVISNLMQLEQFLSISQPMCWAYGDMLTVGSPAPWVTTHCPGEQRLSFSEAQGEFSAWAVLSSPLVLGIDVTNRTEYDMWWPIVSNTEAIAINQQWAGEAGHLIAAASELYTGPVNAGWSCEATIPSSSLPVWTVWGKRLPGSTLAAVALNTLDNQTAVISISTAQLGFPEGATLHVRDVNAHTDNGTITGSWDVKLPPRGSQFVVFAL